MLFNAFLILFILIVLYILLKSDKILIEKFAENCEFKNINALPEVDKNEVIQSVKKYANKELSLRERVEFTRLVVNNVKDVEILEMDLTSNCFIQNCNDKCICESYRTLDNSKFVNIQGGNIRIKSIEGTKLDLFLMSMLKVKVPIELKVNGVKAKVETNCNDKFIVREIDFDNFELIHPSPDSMVGKLIKAIPKQRILNGMKTEVIDKEIPLISKPEIKYVCN